MSAHISAPSHYEILRLRSDASPDEIRDAWRQHQPDHGALADTDTTKRINRAYEVLSSPHERAQHDVDLLANRTAMRRRRPIFSGKALWLPWGVTGLVFGALAGELLYRTIKPATRQVAAVAAQGTQAPLIADTPLMLVPARHLESWTSGNRAPTALHR